MKLAAPSCARVMHLLNHSSYHLLCPPLSWRGASASFCRASQQQKQQHTTTLADRCSKQLEVKKSKFIAWAAPVDSERDALQFLDEVSDSQATHNCWAFKVKNIYRFNDDGEPGGTAGRPIHSSIVSSSLDGVVVVVTRYYGGIKLGTGGLVRAYGGVALDCLREAKTVVVKPKVDMSLCFSFDLLGVLYPLMHAYEVEKLHEEYDVGGKGGTRMRVLVQLDKASSFEEAVKNASSGRAQITWQKDDHL